ncbi:hypothetical protein RB25_25235 [Herbaspirillum rubrisubalbicans]|uniref:DUF4935 domain-containing protein n=1 Tax=Herbaspirillum rubrisubalbicans Os34 TaxID=1235827 RepID=A0A6M3ZV25_9BURK|nr:PIN domain-containing protein [Herbaspirillum rubrisubalbicans]QJQ02427.1 hypothetical protein C798_19960 [Herbaspirillum rubrisubalbicans Os34]RAN42702.1 hypothetical protein RB25_25235 [Herbaspirillum rubrisubalbicans]
MKLDTLVQEVVAQGGPVLCVDTCSVLDLLRDPTRDDVRTHNISSALDMVAGMEAGGLTCLVADQVRKELAEHLDQIQEDAKIQLQKLTDRVNRVNLIAALFGQVGAVNLAHLDGHEQRARQIVQKLIDVAKFVPQGAQIAGLAFTRVVGPKAPARQGKDSIKDCVVIETYFDVIRALRKDGLQSKIVFLSSNTKDYMGNQSNALHADLVPEFQELGIEYAPNASAAKHFLGV